MFDTYDLDTLAALEAAATKGKLRHGDGSMSEPDEDDTQYNIRCEDGAGVYVFEFPSKSDAELFEQARNALPAMIADLREALELLREVEWAGYSMFGQGPFCVRCGKYKSNGHAPDCRLDALKRRLEGK